MFKFLGKLFNSEKALEATVKAVTSGLDKLVYTDEEKADAAAGNRSEGRRMIIEWMEKSSGHNLTRRFLAISISLTWLSMYIGAGVTAVTSAFVSEPESWQLASQYLLSYSLSMNGAVMLLLGFYFAASHIDKIVGVAMNKFGTAPEINFKKEEK